MFLSHDVPTSDRTSNADEQSASVGWRLGHVDAIPALGPAATREQESGFITSLRHEQLLRESFEALEKARKAAQLGIPHEMLLLDLYAGLRPIDAITGATTADDILNRIFSTFCIGK